MASHAMRRRRRHQLQEFSPDELEWLTGEPHAGCNRFFWLGNPGSLRRCWPARRPPGASPRRGRPSCGRSSPRGSRRERAAHGEGAARLPTAAAVDAALPVDDLAERIARTAERFRAEVVEGRAFMTGDRRVGVDVAARLVGLSASYLKNLRNGSGPRWYRIGGAGHRVTYRLDDLAAWVEGRRDEG